MLAHEHSYVTIRESNHASRVYIRSIKISILLAGTGVWEISSVACWFSPIKIDYSDYPKSLISRMKFMYFSLKYGYSDILLKNIKLHL